MTRYLIMLEFYEEKPEQAAKKLYDAIEGRLPDQTYTHYEVVEPDACVEWDTARKPDGTWEIEPRRTCATDVLRDGVLQPEVVFKG